MRKRAIRAGPAGAAPTTTVFTEARCSGVAMGWEARKLTKGGARCRVVGLCDRSSPRNTAGSKLGTVTVVPPCQSMLDMVTFMANMWYIGRTQMVISSLPTTSTCGAAICTI